MESGYLKVILPKECNDPLEFLAQGDTARSPVWLQYGFLSFTTSYKSSAMWGHYADKHKGCCIHFRFPHTGPKKFPISECNDDCEYYILPILQKGPSFTTYGANCGQKKIDQTVLCKIIYTENRVRYSYKTMTYMDTNQRDYYTINPCLITKSKDWQYEQELRILIPVMFPEKAVGPNFFVSDFNQYIQSVILGCECPHDDTTTAASIHGFLGMKDTENKSFPVFRSSIQPDEFSIECKEYDTFLDKLNKGEPYTPPYLKFMRHLSP